MAVTDERIDVTGRNLRELASRIVCELASILPETPGPDDGSAVTFSTSIQAEGITPGETLNRLARDMIGALAESPLAACQVELGQVLSTGHGFRVWGYLSFGPQPKARTVESAHVELVDDEPGHDVLRARLTLSSTPAPRGGQNRGRA